VAVKQDDTIRKLRTQLRDSRRKSPIRQRLELAVTKGAPAFSGGLALGYIEEVHGPERGAQATAAMGIGGLAALFVLNPKQNSLVEILLSGSAASGMAVMAKEHGKTLGRYARVKKAQAQLEAENQRQAQQGQIDDVESPVLEEETITESERVTG